MSNFKQQLEEGVEALVAVSKGEGFLLGESCAQSAVPVMEWVEWYKISRPNSFAQELLEGTRSAILETAAYVGFGLCRAALSSLRAQIDLLLSFSYFKDHPAEWRLVNWTGDGFKLRSEIVRYHQEIDPKKGGFFERLGMIDQVCKPTLEDCYRTLSAHVHGQSPFTMPKSTMISQLICDGQVLNKLSNYSKRVP